MDARSGSKEIRDKEAGSAEIAWPTDQPGDADGAIVALFEYDEQGRVVTQIGPAGSEPICHVYHYLPADGDVETEAG